MENENIIYIGCALVLLGFIFSVLSKKVPGYSDTPQKFECSIVKFEISFAGLLMILGSAMILIPLIAKEWLIINPPEKSSVTAVLRDDLNSCQNRYEILSIDNQKLKDSIEETKQACNKSLALHVTGHIQDSDGKSLEDAVITIREILDDKELGKEITTTSKQQGAFDFRRSRLSADKGYQIDITKEAKKGGDDKYESLSFMVGNGALDFGILTLQKKKKSETEK